MLTVFKRKSIWLAILVGTILIGLFAFAQVGARSSVKIRHLPVALVVADHGTQAKKVAHQLRRTNSESDAKIKWITVKKTANLTDGFANSRYYGALVIHNGFSADLQRQANYLKGQLITQKLTAMATKQPAVAMIAPFQQQKQLAKALTAQTPQAANVTLYVSQGNNITVANLLTTALPQLVTHLNQTLTGKYQQVANKANLTLTAANWSQLQTPIKSNLVKRNPVSEKQLSGMAPFIITILCWIGCLVSSLINWRDHISHESRRTDGRLSMTSVTSQLITGLLIAGGTALAIYSFVKLIYGMPIQDSTQFIWLTGGISFVFYLIQTAVLDLAGLKGWPLLLVIWIGSMGVITFVPQMLSNFYRQFVYNVTPIHFAYELINNQLYLQNAPITGAALTVMMIIGLSAIVLMYSSTLIKGRQPATEK